MLGHLFGEDGRQVHFVLPVFFHLVVLGGEAKAHRRFINSTSNKLFFKKDRWAVSPYKMKMVHIQPIKSLSKFVLQGVVLTLQLFYLSLKIIVPIVFGHVGIRRNPVHIRIKGTCFYVLSVS